MEIILIFQPHILAGSIEEKKYIDELFKICNRGIILKATSYINEAMIDKQSSIN